MPTNRCRISIPIERAQPWEAPALSALAFGSKGHWGYPQAWIDEWRAVLTLEPVFIAAHETFAGRREGRTVGFYALAAEHNQINLVHFWILPEAMGQGIGRTLFAHAIERVKALGFRELQIESDP